MAHLATDERTGKQGGARRGGCGRPRASQKAVNRPQRLKGDRDGPV